MSDTTEALVAHTLSLFYRAQVWACVVLGALALGAMIRRRARPKRDAPSAPVVAGGDGLPRLTVLSCAGCGASAPIALHPTPCSHCGRFVAPPADYVHALALRAEAAEQLRAAVRRWRVLRLWVSPPVTITLIPLAIAWLFATTLGAAVGAPPEGSPAIGYGFVIGAFGMWAIFALRMAALDAFHRLPTLPDGVDARVGRAETVDCGACGAPTRFGQRDFASMCGYCGAENYRVALARRAHAGAAKANREAKVSVYAAMLEVRARFRGMLETMEIAALFAGFVVALAFIVRFLDQC